jgi:hypothetical protein
MLRLEFAESLLERLARLDWLALARHRGCDLAPARARRPVGVGLRARDLFDAALHTYLPARRVEEHRSPRVLGQLPPFPALVTREEDEAALVGALQQHHPHRRRAVASGRRQRDHLGLEPRAQLLERIR